MTTNLIEIWIKNIMIFIQENLKLSSVKQRPFCSGLNVLLIHSQVASLCCWQLVVPRDSTPTEYWQPRTYMGYSLLWFGVLTSTCGVRAHCIYVFFCLNIYSGVKLEDIFITHCSMSSLMSPILDYKFPKSTHARIEYFITFVHIIYIWMLFISLLGVLFILGH